MISFKDDKPPLVLVIDDSDAQVELALTALKKISIKGYGFGGLPIPQDLIDLQTSPGVAIVDLHLEDDLTGPEMIKQLRDLWPGLPAILVTGSSEGPELRQALSLPGVTLLRKPYRLQELVDLVQRTLGAGLGS